MLNSAQNKLVVGVSDAKFSTKRTDDIITYSLGSCIGVCLYEPRRGAGAMFHFQLPESKLDPDKAMARPFMFADTGLKLALQSMISAGCRKKDLIIKIAGGASMRNGPSNFDIGKRNHLSIRKCLWQSGLMISAEDVGGDFPRTVRLCLETGTVYVKSPSGTKEL